MRIGAGCRIDAGLVCHLHHLEEVRVQVRLPLKIVVDVRAKWLYIAEYLLQKLEVHTSGRASKAPQSGRTFGTPKVARGSGLDGQAQRTSPMDRTSR